MIKALFFDLDGTLLDDKKVILPKTRKALEKCREEGIKLFISTGRAAHLDRMLLWDNETLSLFNGGVYCNGGYVKTDGLDEYALLPNEIVKEIIAQSLQYDKLNIVLQLKEGKQAFRFPIDEKYHKAWGIEGKKTYTLEQMENEDIIKMIIFYTNLMDSEIMIEQSFIQELKDKFYDKTSFYVMDKGTSVQIMKHLVSKFSGAEKIRKSLGLEKDEIAVFGDDTNDIEMLSGYPNGIAMGNAEEYVKRNAKYVTLDNNSEGIYHALTNILKIF